MADVPYREGARSRDARDACPLCGKAAPIFASHFEKFGKHRVVACEKCGKVSENEKERGVLEVFPEVP